MSGDMPVDPWPEGGDDPADDARSGAMILRVLRSMSADEVFTAVKALDPREARYVLALVLVPEAEWRDSLRDEGAGS